MQRIQTRRGAPPNEWVESGGSVLAEHRGSTLIERYIDPNDQGLPDFATEGFADANLDSFYQFRVLRRKRFAP